MDLENSKNFNVSTGIVYFGSRDPYHYIFDLEEILTHHCTFVIYPVTEEDIELHQQNLTEIFDVSKKSGLGVLALPFGIGHVFEGDSASKFVLENRNSWQVSANFQPVPAACMNNFEFKAFLYKWIDLVVELGVDGIVWDNPHYYIPKNETKMLQWGCWCNSCNQVYLQKFDHRLPRGIGEEINLLNEYSIIIFLKELCEYAKQKNLINIVCLSPQNVNNLSMSGWHQVSELQTLDFLAAKAFWYYYQYRADSYVKGVAKKVSDLCEQHAKKSQIWIQNFKLLAGEEKQVEQAIEICINEKIDSIVSWSYYGSRAISSLRCQNPKAIWDLLGNMFERFILQ